MKREETHRGTRARLEGLLKRIGFYPRLRASNVVWIFGSQRTGSTWLARMMGDMNALWDEPLVGLLFGEFYERFAPDHAASRAAEFVFGDGLERIWLPSVREFVLMQLRRRFRGARFVIVKEPNGSVGAPLLMRAMPESRMVLLVRDPRDAVASSLASHQKGGWLYKWAKEAERESWAGIPDEHPDTFVDGRARFYAASIESAKRAYDAHTGPKVLVRYEDLASDTLATMRHLYSGLGISVEEEQLGRVVRKHAFENLPDREKGSGTFNRKGKVGSFREDLTNHQVWIVETLTRTQMREFYPEAHLEGQPPQ